MTLQVVIAFCLASFLLGVTPGPTMSLVIANVTKYGFRAGLLTMAGNLTGLAILLAAVSFGLSSIMLFMAEWFDVIRWVGAAYLMWLGAHTLWKLHRPAAAATTSNAVSSRWYWQGLFVAISNPKVLLFLGAFLPQFLDPVEPALPQLVLLSLVFIVTIGLVDLAYAGAVARARVALSGRWQRSMEAGSGALLLCAGVWLAFARRPA